MGEWLSHYGNSLTLYARTHNPSNKEAYLELTAGGNVYPFPRRPVSPNTEKQPRPLAERHEAYTDMLHLPSLSDAHRANLRKRGLSDDRIVSKASGDTRIYLVYCRDNRRVAAGTISRELVKETLNEDTNRYEKLANISLAKIS